MRYSGLSLSTQSKPPTKVTKRLLLHAKDKEKIFIIYGQNSFKVLQYKHFLVQIHRQLQVYSRPNRYFSDIASPLDRP